MQVSAWLDRYQQRHPWAGFPLAVLYKFADDQGNYLAALITYYAFLSLFPLLLLLASVLGFVLQGNPELQEDILDSTLRTFPVIGDELDDPRGLRGSVAAVVVGGLVALYGALGVAQALQHAMNVVWAVPRHRRPNPIKARLRSLLLLATGGVAVLATTVLSALGSAAAGFGADLSRGASALATLAAVAINAAVFVLAFRIATAQRLSTREAAPGALAAAVVWQALQLSGSAYVARVSEGTSATYGTFALVLGLLAWIYLGATAVVLCVEINAVRTKHLYPRALLTPFTDDVDLTRADEHTYTEAATAQRAKAFESVHVSFDRDRVGRAADDDGPPEPADRSRAGRLG